MPFDFAKMIEDEIRRRFEDVVAQMILVDDRWIASEKAEKRLLQQIVRDRRVADHPKDVGPDGPRRLSIEGLEFCLVHRLLWRSPIRRRAERKRRLQCYCACGDSHCLVNFHETAAEMRKPTPSPIRMKAGMKNPGSPSAQ